MDDSSVAPSNPPVNQDDEWDTDGFEIPSLGIEDPDNNKAPTSPVGVTKPSSLKDQTPKKEGIHEGTHDTHSSQHKQIEPSPTGRKKKLKHKLKVADNKRMESGTVRENNLEHLRELVGTGTQNTTSNIPKSSTRDWLDPHCHESEFERRSSQ